MCTNLVAPYQSAVHPLTLPSLDNYTPDAAHDLTKIVELLYHHCQDNPKIPEGSLHLTYDYDLTHKHIHIKSRQGTPKHITRLTASWYVQKESRLCIGREWVFIANDTTETFHTSSRGYRLPEEFFNGLELEKRATSQERCEHDPNFEFTIYSTEIHPRIIDSIKIISALFLDTPLHILDIGGGTGRLAEKILEQLHEKVHKLVILDKSQSACDKSRLIARKFPEQLKVKKMDAVHEALNQEADVIILSGVLQHSVLTLPEAQTLLIQSHRMLRKGGYLLIASRFASIFSTKDYEQLSLTVLNRTISHPSQAGPMHPCAVYAFYILQKSGEPQ